MLTTTQLTVLGNLFNTDPAYTGHSVSDDGANELAIILNGASTTSVWRTSTPVQDVEDAILGTKYTPSDIVTAVNAVVMTANLLVCQCKQMDLQILLQGREYISTGKPNIRAWLQDAMTGIPSGTNGAQVGAGYATVKALITRFATKAEALFASGLGTAQNPSDLVYEGLVTVADVQAARAIVGVS